MELVIILIIIAALFSIWTVFKRLDGHFENNQQPAVREKAPQQESHESFMETVRMQCAIAEVMKQAEVMGDGETIDSIKNGTYSGAIPKKITPYYYESVYPDELLVLPIAGINYREDIKRYVGEFNGVLVPEPENDYDPDAIMIKCEDGHLLGYIPEEKTIDVRDLIGADFKRHRIKGRISDKIGYDDDGNEREFFVGYIYITK